MKGSRVLLRNGGTVLERFQSTGTRRWSSMRAVEARPGMCAECGRMQVSHLQRQAANKPLSRSINTSAVSNSWHASPAKPPSSHPTISEPLPEQLRSIMRLLPHSVVVCTSRGSDGGIRAMTMSSFTSLTLSPTPLVTFNIATPSRTFDAISESGAFTVHILAGDATGATVASHFTRGNKSNALEGLDVTCEGDIPVLRGEGVMFALRCKIVRDAADGGLVKVRDHVIVIGEVVEMVPIKGEQGFGLTYGDRRYRQVGGVLEQE